MSWSDEVRTPNFDKHRTATSTPQPAGLKSVKQWAWWERSTHAYGAPL